MGEAAFCDFLRGWLPRVPSNSNSYPSSGVLLVVALGVLFVDALFPLVALRRLAHALVVVVIGAYGCQVMSYLPCPAKPRSPFFSSFARCAGISTT